MSKFEPDAGGGREDSLKEDDDQTLSGATLHSTHLEAIYQRVEYRETHSILPVDDLEMNRKTGSRINAQVCWSFID